MTVRHVVPTLRQRLLGIFAGLMVVLAGPDGGGHISDTGEPEGGAFLP